MQKDNKKINVLIYGLRSLSTSLIRNFQKSDKLGKIYIMDKGKNNLLKKVTYIGDTSRIKVYEHIKFIKEKNIDFVIAYHDYLEIFGLVDLYKNKIKVPVIGTTSRWYLIETDKLHGKKFMTENNIKTPEYITIEKKEDLKKYY